MIPVEPDFGILRVGKGLETRVACEGVRGPLPDVARHVHATAGARAVRETPDRRRPPETAVKVAQPYGRLPLAPSKAPLPLARVVPRGGLFPLGFRRQALPHKTRISLRLIPAHACDWMMRRHCCFLEHCFHAPAVS